MEQKLILLFFMLLLSRSASAEDNADSSLYHSIGIAAITDYMQAPATVYTKYGSSGYDEQFIDQYKGISLITIIYNCRYNLLEISNEVALSASLTPAIGLFTPFNSDAKGFGSVNIPLMAGLEMGAGSTFRSTAGLGTFLRFGMEWTMAPLRKIKFDDYSEAVTLESSWVEPVAQFGIRFWNKGDVLHEVSLKYGFGAAVPSGDYSTDSGEPSRAITLRISWLMFINY